MVIVELLEMVIRWLTETFGINGIAIGATAFATAGLWYLREFANVLATLAVYARVASGVMFGLLIVLVVGTGTGVLDLSANGSALGQLWRAIINLIQTHV